MILLASLELSITDSMETVFSFIDRISYLTLLDSWRS